MKYYSISVGSSEGKTIGILKISKVILMLVLVALSVHSFGQSWSGTCFALTRGYIVTNYHVVEDAVTIHVQGVNGDFTRKYRARVIATDKVNDIALLKLEGVTPTDIPYAVKTSTSDVGEDIWVLGYPLTSTMGDEIKLTTGVVSARSGFAGDVALYQISAPIQPGNSGGPVFDGQGNLIGIVCAHHSGAENVGYAIKASYLRNLMESALDDNILPRNNKIATLNLKGKVKAVKNYVYYITCSSSGNGTSNQGNGFAGGNSISGHNGSYYGEYVDMGLPSGTKWKKQNEGSGYYTYDEAVRTFGSKLPTKEQLSELKEKCRWEWTGRGYKVIGPNGNSIYLPAAGYRYCDGYVDYVGADGAYWSSTPNGSDYAWGLDFYSLRVDMYYYDRCRGYSVRLVQD